MKLLVQFSSKGTQLHCIVHVAEGMDVYCVGNRTRILVIGYLGEIQCHQQQKRCKTLINKESCLRAPARASMSVEDLCAYRKIVCESYRWRNKEVQYVIVYKSIAGDLRKTMDGKASCSVEAT